MTSPLLCVPCVGLLVLTTWLTQPTMPQQPAAATNPATTPVARTDQGIVARQSEVLTRAKAPVRLLGTHTSRPGVRLTWV